jgi:DNA primase
VNNLKSQILNWLVEDHKISEKVLHNFDIFIQDNGTIVIPIKDINGKLIYNKYRRNPIKEDPKSPKYFYDKGGSVALFNIEALKCDDNQLIMIVEGELKALCLESYGIKAVSSTGGAISFQSEWGELFKNKKNLVVCLDNDLAGIEGMIRVQHVIPHARLVLLPSRNGVKDITEYFQHYTLNDFLQLRSRSYNIPNDLHHPYTRPLIKDKTKEFADAAEQLKEDIRNNNLLNRDTRLEEEVMKYCRTKYEQYKMLERSISNRSYVNGGLEHKNRVEKAKLVPIPEFIRFKGEYANCLWHNEKSPSMHYIKESNQVKCFGCGKFGSVIDVVMQQQGLTFLKAVNYLLGEEITD